MVTDSQDTRRTLSSLGWNYSDHVTTAIHVADEPTMQEIVVHLQVIGGKPFGPEVDIQFVMSHMPSVASISRNQPTLNVRERILVIMTGKFPQQASSALPYRKII